MVYYHQIGWDNLEIYRLISFILVSFTLISFTLISFYNIFTILFYKSIL
jgi:hypothetical protein